MKEYQLYIDGQYSPSASGEYSDDMNPATDQVYARIQNAGKDDLERVRSKIATSITLHRTHQHDFTVLAQRQGHGRSQ